MYGLIQYSLEKGKTSLREESVCGLRFWAETLPEPGRGFLRRRAVVCAARKLTELGVVRAVFPEAFPDGAVFAEQGILPVETLPLYRALTGELARTALEVRGLSGGGAVVAVLANQLTAEVRRAVTELCVRNRYVILSAPDRNGAFSRQLRREYGAPVVLSNEPAQLARAAVAVCFVPYAPVSPDQTVIDLSREGGAAGFRLTLEEREEELPSGRRDQLLAALWASGALRPSQVTVKAEAAGQSGL